MAGPSRFCDHTMSNLDVPREPQAFVLWREAQDTRIRTRLGGIYYLLAWLLTWLFSDAPADLLAWGLAGVAFFALMLTLRLLHRLPAEQTPQALRSWLDHHWGLVLLTAAVWGLVHAWALNDPAFTRSWLIATLSTIAFSTALAFNFSMRRGRAIAALLLLYLPGLVALALDWREQQAPRVPQHPGARTRAAGTTAKPGATQPHRQPDPTGQPLSVQPPVSDDARHHPAPARADVAGAARHRLLQAGQ
jgi:hypothetical protein